MCEWGTFGGFLLFFYSPFVLQFFLIAILEQEYCCVCFFISALFSLPLVPFIRYWCIETVVSVA